MTLKERLKKFEEDHPRTTFYTAGLTIGLITGLSLGAHKRDQTKIHAINMIVENATNVARYAEVTFKNGSKRYFEFVEPFNMK